MCKITYQGKTGPDILCLRGREVARFCQQRLPKALSKSNRRAFFEEPVPLSGWGNGTPTGHTKQNAADSHAAGKALVSAIESHWDIKRW